MKRKWSETFQIRTKSQVTHPPERTRRLIVQRKKRDADERARGDAWRA